MGHAWSSELSRSCWLGLGPMFREISGHSLPALPGPFAGQLKSEADTKPMQITAFPWSSKPEVPASGRDGLLIGSYGQLQVCRGQA